MTHTRFYTRLAAIVLLTAVLLTAPFVNLSAQEDTGDILYWTCGMHPTVRSETEGKCPICNMDLVPVYEQQREGSPPEGAPKASVLMISPDAARLARIRTVEVTRRHLVRMIRAAGQVSYDETRLAVVSARVGGRIDKLFADYTGTEFAAGEPLAKIYSPELLSAQKEFILARNTTLESAAREKLLLWGITTAQLDALDHRGEPLTELTIHAPIGGTVVHKNIVEGAYVKEGDPLLHLANLDRVWIVADIFEHNLSAVKVGQRAQITSETYPGEEFAGQVAFVDPFLDAKMRSAKIRIETGNADRRLKPGMFVRVEIQNPIVPMDHRKSMESHETVHMHESTTDTDNIQDAAAHEGHEGHQYKMESIDTSEHGGVLAVPRSAVINTGTRTVAFVEIEPGRYELRRISIGPPAEGYYVILDGLHEGERVVERGAFLLDSQTQLTGEAEEVYSGAIGKESKQQEPVPHRH